MPENIVCGACRKADSDGIVFENGDCLCRNCYDAVIETFFDSSYDSTDKEDTTESTLEFEFNYTIFDKSKKQLIHDLKLDYIQADFIDKTLAVLRKNDDNNAFYFIETMDKIMDMELPDDYYLTNYDEQKMKEWENEHKL